MFIKFVRTLLKKLPKIGVRKSGLLFTRDNIRIDYEFEYCDKGMIVYIEVWFDPEKKFHIKLYDDDTVNVYAYLPPNSNDVKLTYIIHRSDGRVEDEQTYDALTQDEKALIRELANEVSLAETAMTIDAYCEYCRKYEEYDIKNIKLKLINEGLYIPAETENKIYNSPWNIAVNFKVDMSFKPMEIATMLKEYEADHDTGMNIVEISEEIYNYTSGYPFLVSRICQCIDEEINKNWTVEGIQEAVKIILHEQNTLFRDLFKNLENNQNLYDFIYDVLITGRQRTFSAGNPVIDMALTYDIIKKENEKVTVSNKIFEIIICDYFISKDENNQTGKTAGIIQQDILKNGRFDMELCLRKFADHYAELFNEEDKGFLERHGRLMFLSYLKPLINGQGFYHIESQFTDLRRMDIVVDFGRDQFIVELKIWRGEKYEENAYKQLIGYMETKKAEKGYLLMFDFREETNKERKAEWIEFDGKRIFDIMI